MLKKVTFSPAQPRRAKTRRSTGKAAASERPRRYPPHFVGPFAIRMDLGERKSPYSASGLREAPLNVEGLNDARTLLADFFSILLSAGRCLSMFCRYPVQILWRLVRMAREPFLQYYIDRGDEKKREDCRDTESSNHRARQWGVRFPAGSPANGHREQSKNGGEGGHQNGPESRPRSGDRRVV